MNKEKRFSYLIGLATEEHATIIYLVLVDVVCLFHSIADDITAGTRAREMHRVESGNQGEWHASCLS